VASNAARLAGAVTGAKGIGANVAGGVGDSPSLEALDIDDGARRVLDLGHGPEAQPKGPDIGRRPP
jgi:hypothetical protein